MLRWILTAAVLSNSASATTSAQGSSAYQTYLTRIEQALGRYEAFGIDSREMQQLEATVRSRARVGSQNGYVEYVALLQRVEQRFEPFGFDASEKAVMKLLLEAAPRDVDAVDAAAYKAVCEGLDRALTAKQNFGFDASEREMLELFERAVSGALRVRRSSYDEAYQTWATLTDTWEKRFADFGIDQQEASILDLIRRHEPRLAKGKRQPSGNGGEGESPGQAGGGEIGSAEILEICGVRFPLQRYQTRGDRTLALTASGELSEIDRHGCRIRFLADEVAAFQRLPQRQGVLVFRRNGSSFYVRQDGDAYKLAFEEQSGLRLEQAQPGDRLVMQDGAGKRRSWEPTDQVDAEKGLLQMRIDDRPVSGKFRYRVEWRRLR
jgi:hypothetical protein